MILVDGEKYACVQCIRGHRSSTCKHSLRPLVQVRSRGRPSLNAGHRIAVTESQLVLSRDEVNIQEPAQPSAQNSVKEELKEDTQVKDQIPAKSCCSSKKKEQSPLPEAPKSCCSKKTQPLPTPSSPAKSCCAGSKPSSSTSIESDSPCTSSQVAEKTCSSATHADCNCGKNGVIMLKASKRQFVDVKNGNLDFVGPYNESSLSKFKIGLQSSSKRFKHSRNCSKSSKNASAAFNNRLKFLKTLKMNEMDYQIPRDQLQGLGFPLAQQAHMQQYSAHQPNDTGNHYQSETYTKDILALGLPVNFPSAEPIHPLNSKHFDQAFREFQNEQNQQQLQVLSQPQHKFFDVAFSSGCASECNCGPGCDCPGCLIHRTNEELKEYGILDTSPVSTPDVKGSPSPVNYDLINLQTIDEMLLKDMFEEECYCEESECCCYNCSKHGISEGVRLSDGKRVAEPDGGLDFGREITPDGNIIPGNPINPPNLVPNAGL